MHAQARTQIPWTPSADGMTDMLALRQLAFLGESLFKSFEHMPLLQDVRANREEVTVPGSFWGDIGG